MFNPQSPIPNPQFGQTSDEKAGLFGWGLGIGDWGLGIGDWGLNIRQISPSTLKHLF